MNKLTLVIDGNWLLMSRFFVVTKKFSKDLPEHMREEASRELALTLSQSINIVLRRFNGVIDNIILVTDNKSWRKNLEKPSSLSIDYKGNRSSDSSLDMENVFNTLTILSENLIKQGITVSNRYGCEGDDWAWYWSRKLNSQGINTLLWTIDEDIMQLVQLDKNTAAFTAWYNDKGGVVFHSCMEKQEVSDIDFFLIQEFTNKSFYDIKNIVPKVRYIDPSTIICKKIFVGDTGDNIKPIFTTEKNNKTYKGTEKDYIKIDENFFADAWELINNSNKEEVDEVLKKVYNKLVTNKSKKLGVVYTNLQEFIDHFHYNKQLVWLSDRVIPGNVILEMNNVEYKVVSKDNYNNILLNYKYMGEASTEHIEKIFDSLDELF